MNAQDDYKSTPLHYALKGGNVESARVLLENGADVSAQDMMGFTPFERAESGGFHDITQLLLAYGTVGNGT